MQFKKGDKIEAKERGMGFEEATVLGTVISKSKKFKGKEMYLLKIMNGTATIPITAEDNYKLSKHK
jgi:hypothetical protein